MPTFIHGMRLSELFHRDVVAPLLRRRFRRMRYSAGFVGGGSEILGFDDRESTDHQWGLRLSVFVGQRDYDQRRDRVWHMFSVELPVRDRGYSTNFTPPDPNDNGTRRPLFVERGPVNHMIEIETPEIFFRRKLGIDPRARVTDGQWLKFSEQSLLEVTAGKIFHDGLRELRPLRRRFAYYPRNVWLELMARQWHEIGEEEPFVGRTGFRGDEVGSRVIAARLVHRLMQLCFLIERRYAPYSKWLGTAFRDLSCSRGLRPSLERALSAADWQTRQAHLSRAYEFVARLHNALAITMPLPVRVSQFHNRPYQVIHGGDFAAAIRRAASRD